MKKALIAVFVLSAGAAEAAEWSSCHGEPYIEHGGGGIDYLCHTECHGLDEQTICRQIGGSGGGGTAPGNPTGGGDGSPDGGGNSGGTTPGGGTSPGNTTTTTQDPTDTEKCVRGAITDWSNKKDALNNSMLLGENTEGASFWNSPAGDGAREWFDENLFNSLNVPGGTNAQLFLGALVFAGASIAIENIALRTINFFTLPSSIIPGGSGRVLFENGTPIIQPGIFGVPRIYSDGAWTTSMDAIMEASRRDTNEVIMSNRHQQALLIDRDWRPENHRMDVISQNQTDRMNMWDRNVGQQIDNWMYGSGWDPDKAPIFDTNYNPTIGEVSAMGQAIRLQNRLDAMVLAQRDALEKFQIDFAAALKKCGIE